MAKTHTTTDSLQQDINDVWRAFMGEAGPKNRATC